MAVQGYDIRLNGVGYNLAEDAEGEHYNLAGEPLRPPNAVQVQGADQDFQVRPDILLWTLTDWSGGEGQIKFDPQSPNRWRELTGVRVFERPGTLKPGWYVEDTQYSAADLAADGQLAAGIAGRFLLIDNDDDDVYSWNAATPAWEQTYADIRVGSNGVLSSATGDYTYLFYQERTSFDIVKWDGSTATVIDTTLTSAASLEQLGSYVYAYVPTTGKTYEIAKAGGSTVTIDDHGEEPGHSFVGPHITVSNGRVYVMASMASYTVIREITPSTAAGTGFGAEIARFPGFDGRGIWSHAGTLYVSGTDGEGETVLYIDPQGTYGTLGRMRDGLLFYGRPASTGAKLLDHFLAVEQIGASDTRNAIYQIDSTTGGMAIVAVDEDGDAPSENITSVGVFSGEVFWSTDSGAATRRVKRAYSTGFTKTSQAVSAWHDFNLADEKVLSSLVLSCEALPADWTVYVDYARNGSTSWTNVITYTTTSGNGTEQKVSTDTSTIKFHTLSIRIRMVYGGAGVPSSGPTVLGVDVLAQVVKQQPVWRLLLDIDDDAGRTPDSLSGSKKFANIKAAAAAQNVIAFKDGYSNRVSVTEYDVVIDSYEMILTTPGEGVAQVILREVI